MATDEREVEYSIDNNGRRQISIYDYNENDENQFKLELTIPDTEGYTPVALFVSNQESLAYHCKYSWRLKSSEDG